MDVQLKILQKHLDETTFKTSQQLAEELDVSEKTVRTRLKELGGVLEGGGASVEVKRGTGYRLAVENRTKYNSFLQETTETPPRYATAEERMAGLLFRLLQMEYIKLDDLSEEWHVSKNSLSADLKKVERFLLQFQISLIRKPYYGVKAEGEEFAIRTSFVSFISNHDIFFFDLPKRLKRMRIISDQIVTIVKKHQLIFSERFLQDFLVSLFVQIGRIKDSHRLPTDFPGTKNLFGDRESLVADEITEKFADVFGIDYPNQERDYIALHLAGKRTLRTIKTVDENIIISNRIVELVSGMLDAVHETFGIDFRSNLELRLSLSQHLVPMNIRLRYDLDTTNPLLQEIKDNYPFAYTIALRASVPLKEFYGKDISEDETGYIALLFALELERAERQIAKKNILIVCSSGKGTSQLLTYRFRAEFGDYVNELSACDLYDLEHVDFSKFDYIFTTVPIDMQIPVPIMEVNQFLEFDEILSVKDALESSDKTLMQHYYYRELFFPDIKGKTREEVLREMCVHIGEKRAIPEEFYEAVLRREDLVSTDLGNAVALPHPYKVLTEETFVAVGILEKPILWVRNEVQIVFLVSISKHDDENLQEFYKATTKLLLNKEKIKKIIAEKSFDTLIDSL